EAQGRGARVEREIEFAQVDLELTQARQLAACERLEVLRLSEVWLVACSLDPESDGGGRPLSSLFNLASNSTSLFSERVAKESRPARLAPWRHGLVTRSDVRIRERQESVWPLSDFSTPRPAGVAPGRQVRFHEPAYHEYYEFGNRRTDLSLQAKERFNPGS